MPVKTKRIYDPPSHGDGYRVLIDGIWPRGITRERAAVDQWARELAPSAQLRRWYGHDPDRFEEFARRYRAELGAQRERLSELRRRSRTGVVTLVFAARDAEHSNATVLADVLRRACADASDRPCARSPWPTRSVPVATLRLSHHRARGSLRILAPDLPGPGGAPSGAPPGVPARSQRKRFGNWAAIPSLSMSAIEEDLASGCGSWRGCRRGGRGSGAPPPWPGVRSRWSRIIVPASPLRGQWRGSPCAGVADLVAR